jgi:hypothetical protein
LRTLQDAVVSRKQVLGKKIVALCGLSRTRATAASNTGMRPAVMVARRAQRALNGRRSAIQYDPVMQAFYGNWPITIIAW